MSSLSCYSVRRTILRTFGTFLIFFFFETLLFQWILLSVFTLVVYLGLPSGSVCLPPKNAGYWSGSIALANAGFHLFGSALYIMNLLIVLPVRMFFRMLNAKANTFGAENRTLVMTTKPNYIVVIKVTLVTEIIHSNTRKYIKQCIFITMITKQLLSNYFQKYKIHTS